MAKAGLDKQTILQTASEIADRQGLNSVTLKELANKLNIRSPSLYNHVKGLDDLRTALMLYGWKQLENEIAISAVGKSGDDAVRAMCKSYMDYTTAHPGVFEAMQLYNQFSTKEAMQATENLINTILQVLSSYKLNEEDKFHAIRMFRSFLQGFVSISNNGNFGKTISIQKSFDFSIELLLKGLALLEKSENKK